MLYLYIFTTFLNLEVQMVGWPEFRMNDLVYQSVYNLFPEKRLHSFLCMQGYNSNTKQGTRDTNTISRVEQCI